MAVRLDVEMTGLRIQFSGIDLVAACSRGLFLPFTRILGVRVMARTDAVASSPRLPSPGLRWSQRYRAGCWGVGERRQLWSARESAHVLVVYLAGQPFHRVVLDIREPEEVHRRVDAALLHSKKTSPRRSLRHRRRAATDPEIDRGEQRPQQPPRPSRHLASVQTHAGAPRRTDQGVEGHSAAAQSSTRPPAAGGIAEEHDRPRRHSATIDRDPRDTEPARPNKIDSTVAARLRLYDYRMGQRDRHTDRPGQTSTRPDPHARPDRASAVERSARPCRDPETRIS